MSSAALLFTFAYSHPLILPPKFTSKVETMSNSALHQSDDIVKRSPARSLTSLPGIPPDEQVSLCHTPSDGSFVDSKDFSECTKRQISGDAEILRCWACEYPLADYCHVIAKHDTQVWNYHVVLMLLGRID